LKYFIIAGEASGDLHGSHLMRSLHQQDESAAFEYWGGDKMAEVYGQPFKHITDLAFMGFWEVAKNINTIRGNFALCKKQIETFEPDALILIDYPGFNLRMAEWAKKKKITVYYYISPQLWAWKSKRIEKIKKFVDRLFVILPFEKTYYEDRNVDVSYYGHPLADIISDYRQNHQVEEREIHAIFPGSRTQEISKILPRMIAGAERTNIDTFYISKSTSVPRSFYENLIADHDRFQLFDGDSYELFNHSRSALVTSGTATLECALFDVPQVVCYYGSQLSYAIAKRLVNIDYIALANLIVDEAIVCELIQQDCNPERIQEELIKLENSDVRASILNGYDTLKNKLQTGEQKSVPDLIASEIIDRLN